MAIEFVCPACQGTLRVGDDAAGRIVRCGSCMTTLRVPAEAPTVSDNQPPRSAAEPVTPPSGPSESRPRPVRRRRRTPPPQGGRNILVWLLVVFGLIAFLILLVCG